MSERPNPFAAFGDLFITEILRRNPEGADAAVDALAATMQEFAQRQQPQPLETVLVKSVVYYIQRPDSAIKIGYSSGLMQRMKQISQRHGAVNLLAFEPGGFTLEQKRHREFRHHRISPNGEWFNPGADLVTHVIFLQPPKK